MLHLLVNYWLPQVVAVRYSERMLMRSAIWSRWTDALHIVHFLLNTDGGTEKFLVQGIFTAIELCLSLHDIMPTLFYLRCVLCQIDVNYQSFHFIRVPYPVEYSLRDAFI